MTKEVMVSISGLQFADQDDHEEQEAIEMVHIGEYYRRNGAHYILFDELFEGIPGPVKNVIKIRGNCLEVQKRGPVTASLIFEEGRTQRSTYAVPYGSFLVDVCTIGVRITETEERLEATAAYALEINGAHCADCDIRVTVQPRETFQL